MKKELVHLSLSLMLVGVSVEAASAQARPQRAPRGTAAQGRPPVTGARPRTFDPRLERILMEWEARSSKIQTLQAEFSHYYYDEVFGQRDPNTGRVKAQLGRGELVFESPDKGVFRVYDGEKRGLLDLIEKDRERWVCTGTEVYQYDNRLKQVTITPLPPEMRGTAISQGPLPFIFGMKAQQAKQRYRMLLRPLKEQRPQDVLIEVHPLRSQDLENFSRAFVILDTKSYLPRAIQVDEPRAASAQGAKSDQPVSRSVYVFHDSKGRSTIAVNLRISGSEFSTPTRGYHVVRNEALVSDDGAPASPRQSGAVRRTRNR